MSDDAAGYRYLEHTADIGIEAWGPDLRCTFAAMAKALCDLMVDPATVEERTERHISVAGDDPEDLLVAFLSALIALVDSDGLVVRRVVIEQLDAHHVEAAVWGEALDARRHHVRTAVKAATYHALSVKPGPPARARVLLDL